MTTTRLTVEVCGQRFLVEVSDAGGRMNVVVNGEPQQMDAARLARGRWSLLAGTSRQSRDLRVRHGRSGAWTVFLDGTPVPVLVPTRGRGRAASGAAVDSASGPARLTAPMPGRVVRVLVAPGETVSARQAVVVVEAMKMENELRAPRPGTVREVLVREGTSVETGAPLVVIE